MKRRLVTIIIAVLLQGLLLTPVYADYLFDTGRPDTPGLLYDLTSERTLIAAEFANSVTWDIGSIEGYFYGGDQETILKAMIWGNTSNKPGSVIYESAPFLVDKVADWQGVFGIDGLSLTPGTYWMGFVYVSGPSRPDNGASIVAFAPRIPDDSLNDAQYALVGDPPTWTWYITDYDFSFRMGDTTTVPLPPSVWLLGSGLLGLAAFRRKLTK